MTKTLILAALAAATLATPAFAQYYGGYDDGYRRPRGYDYDYDTPRPRRYRDYDEDYGGPRRGGPPPYAGGPGRGGALSPTCVTPRGACQSTPMPVGGGCVCFVPGIGNVPGQVR